MTVYARRVTAQMTAKFLDQEETCVTEIQGLVGNELMAGPHKAIAQAYIEYRHDRDIAHGRFSKLNQKIQGLVQKSNAELLNENTNKDTQVFAIKEGLNRNPNDSNYDAKPLALECASKRMYPDILNLGSKLRMRVYR